MVKFFESEFTGILQLAANVVVEERATLQRVLVP
jgi:hypothetical protein